LKSDFISTISTKMTTVDLKQLFATEDEQLQKLNLIVHKAVEEEKLLSDKLLDFEDSNPPFGSRLADTVAGFGGSWNFLLHLEYLCLFG
jgi:uncharacterized membrane protein